MIKHYKSKRAVNERVRKAVKKHGLNQTLRHAVEDVEHASDMIDTLHMIIKDMKQGRS